MNTRAKFKCTSIRKYASTIWTDGKMSQGFLYEYELFAVTDDKGENGKFFASTPTGNLKMSAVRDDLFEPGREYYLDFTPAIQPVEV